MASNGGKMNKGIINISMIVFSIIGFSNLSLAQIPFQEEGVEFGMSKAEVAKILNGKFKLKAGSILSNGARAYNLNNQIEFCNCRFSVSMNFEKSDVLKGIFLYFESAASGVFGNREFKITEFANPEPVFSYLENCLKAKIGEPRPHGPVPFAGIRIQQWDFQNVLVSVYWDASFTGRRILMTYEK